MSKTIQFFYDYISPATYIAYKMLPGFAEKHGLTIDYRPVLLGGIHNAVEHKAAVTQAPSKIRWMTGDLIRTAKREGVEFGYNTSFPFMTVGPMRGALVAKERGELEVYNEAMFNATWRDDKKSGDPEVMAAILTEAGLDVAAYAAGAQDPRIKELLKTETGAAVEAGVFGCPTFIVKDELVFGQDRFHVLEEIMAE